MLLSCILLKAHAPGAMDHAGVVHQKYLLRPSSLAFFSRRGSPFGLPLRASDEGSPRPRVARARETEQATLPYPASSDASPDSV